MKKGALSTRTTLMIVYVVGVVVLWYGLPHLISKGFAEVDKNTAPDEHALNVSLEVTKLTLTLSVSLLGALGWFLSRLEDAHKRSRVLRLCVLLIVLAAASAVYFTYATYTAILAQLGLGLFQPLSDLVVEPQKFAFYSFQAAVFLAGLFLVLVLSPEKPR